MESWFVWACGVWRVLLFFGDFEGKPEGRLGVVLAGSSKKIGSKVLFGVPNPFGGFKALTRVPNVNMLFQGGL